MALRSAILRAVRPAVQACYARQAAPALGATQLHVFRARRAFSTPSNASTAPALEDELTEGTTKPSNIEEKQALLLYKIEQLGTDWQKALDITAKAALPLNERIYAALFSALADAEEHDHAVALLNKMVMFDELPPPASNPRNTDDTLRRVLRGFARSASPADALPQLDKFRLKGIDVQAEAYGVIAVKHADSENWIAAASVLTGMQSSSSTVDGATAESLLDKLSSIKQLADRADEARALWQRDTPETDLELHATLIDMCETADKIVRLSKIMP